MRSSVPKVLHPLCGRPLIAWPVEAARGPGAGRVIVVDNPKRRLADHLPDGVEVAIQEEPRGTATRRGGRLAARPDGHGGGHQRRRRAADRRGDRGAGRGARGERGGGDDGDDGARRARRVRARDPRQRRLGPARGRGQGRPATPPPRSSRSARSTPASTRSTAARSSPRSGRSTRTTPRASSTCPTCCPRSARPATRWPRTDRRPRPHARRRRPRRPRVRPEVAQRRILEAHMRDGVTIVDPGSTRIDADGQHRPRHDDRAVHPAQGRDGHRRATPHRRDQHADRHAGRRRRDDPPVPPEPGARGRRRHRRPVRLPAPRRPPARRAKAGTFVEIKNSEIGAGTKVPHLSYIGDADVGEGTNIGAGNITANYDGRHKHRTTIGANVRTSVDTAFVAPVTVGDQAYTGAGTVVTEDVPAGALGIARARQKNIEGYADRKDGDRRDGVHRPS